MGRNRLAPMHDVGDLHVASHHSLAYIGIREGTSWCGREYV